MRLIPLDAPLLDQAIVLARDDLAAYSDHPTFRAAAVAGDLAFAAVEDGRMLGAGGLLHLWPGLWAAWLMPSVHARPRHVAAATRVAKSAFDQRQSRDPATYRRIEIQVRADARWAGSFAAALGFDLECRMRGWGPDGADYHLYARIASGGQ